MKKIGNRKITNNLADQKVNFKKMAALILELYRKSRCDDEQKRNESIARRVHS